MSPPHNPPTQNLSVSHQLTPALSRATHELLGLCIPQVCSLCHLFSGRASLWGNGLRLPSLKVQVLLLQGPVLGQLLLLFLQLLSVLEHHFVRLVERRREEALTTHVLSRSAVNLLSFQITAGKKMACLLIRVWPLTQAARVCSAY